MNDQSRLSPSLPIVPFALLAVSSLSLAQAQAMSPQAVIYIGQSWCGGGYCGSDHRLPIERLRLPSTQG